MTKKLMLWDFDGTLAHRIRQEYMNETTPTIFRHDFIF